METFVLKLLNMSLTASWLIVAVLVLRFCLRRVPKWSICLLWGLVALRLVCPFTLESPLSLIPAPEPLPEAMLSVSEVPAAPIPSVPVSQPSVSGNSQPMIPTNPSPASGGEGLLPFITAVWAMGAGAMLLYGIISYLLLKHRVRTATRLSGNLRQSECVTTPFVLGLLRPTVYLPYGLTEPQLTHILAHEQTHIRRGDHLTKAFGFLILSLHWFNPLVWLADLLLCRDIEVACDEKVIKTMTLEERQSYSATLLRCSVRTGIAACPVAFGGGSVKTRIKNIINYRKPAFWVVLAALVFCGTVAVCFLTDPPEKEPETVSTREESFQRINTLLGEIMADPDISPYYMSPNRYRMIHPEAYHELLSYGEELLDCFVPQLRQAELYGYRQYLMVFLCSEVAEPSLKTCQDPIGWQMPGHWLAGYDRLKSVEADRLSPGYYAPEALLHSYPGKAEMDLSFLDNFYMVTLNGFYIRDGIDRYDATRVPVDWQWKSPYRIDSTDQQLIEPLKFLEETDFYELVHGENCRYQELADGAFLLQNDEGLYLLQKGSGYPKESLLRYVYKLRMFE